MDGESLVWGTLAQLNLGIEHFSRLLKQATISVLRVSRVEQGTGQQLGCDVATWTQLTGPRFSPAQPHRSSRGGEIRKFP